ncbi:MAG: hypothetical protein KAR44_15105 [Candidatus Aegiribacteria sp.]|nr:hypothetical protein [Candidatus Aegiribacteria sp.]
MTEEEKAELEGLSAKETLTEEEQARKAELEVKPLDPQDEFDSAFDEAMSDDDPAKKVDAIDAEAEELEAAKKKEEADKAKAEKAKLAQQDDTTLFTDGPAGDGQDNEGGAEETPEQHIARIEADLAAEKQRNSSWEGRIKAANQRADKAEAGTGKSTTDKGKEEALPNEEDDLILEEFIEEFPSLEKPMKILATKIAREIVEGQMDTINPTLARVQETVESSAIDEHLGKITQAHSDWKQIHTSGALTTWIGKQPNFMQPGLNKVVEDGSAEDIIELFTAYKRATGQLKTSTDSASRKTPEQKLKELEAVRHQSSGPPQDKKKVAKDDFDSAWDEALSK